jgi:arylsulfatase
VEGVALITNDADGNVTLKETDDHLGCKGLVVGGGVGPVVGLFAPPLLASAVVGAAASAVRKSVAQVDGGGAKKLRAALAEAQASMGG